MITYILISLFTTDIEPSLPVLLRQACICQIPTVYQTHTDLLRDVLVFKFVQESSSLR